MRKVRLLIVTITLLVGFSYRISYGNDFSISINATEGLEILPSTGGVTFSAGTFRNDSNTTITLGDFDPITGEVTGGDAVLVFYLNIGDAPLTNVFSNGIEVNQSNTIESAVLFSGVTVDPNQSFGSFGIAPVSFNAPIGATGTIFVGFALFTSSSQTADEVPGVSVPIDIVVGDSTSFIGTFDRIFSSIGGALIAASPFPPPPPPVPPFSRQAVICQRIIGQVTRKLILQIQMAHTNCLNVEARGKKECNKTKRDEKINDGITHAENKLDNRCTKQDYNELGFTGEKEVIQDNIIRETIQTAEQLIRDTYIADYVNKP